MKSNKKLYRCYRKQHKKVIAGIKNYILQNEAESIHILRISIKKIAVLLAAINFAGRNGKLKKYKKTYKPVFKAAGQIRKYGLINDNFKQLPYTATLNTRSVKPDKIQLIKRRIFISKAPKFLYRLKQEKTKLKPHIEDLKPATLKKYIKKELNKLYDLTEPIDFKELHHIRKLIKKIIYGQLFLKHSNTSLLLSKENYRLFKTLEQKIGQWHDKVLLFEFASRNNALNADGLLSMENILKDESKRIWRHIQKSLHPNRVSLLSGNEQGEDTVAG